MIMKLQYLVSNSKIVGFIPLPSYLIKCGLNSTTILIYGMLISRATLSQKNGWIDEEGRVYIRYSNQQLANDTGKSLSTVKNSLKELSEQGFIVRKRIDVRAKLIYVLVPEESLGANNLACNGTRNKPAEGQKAGSSKGKKVATNYISKTNYRTKEYNYQEGESF